MLDNVNTAERNLFIQNLRTTISRIEEAIRILEEQKSQALSGIRFLQDGDTRQTNLLDSLDAS